MPESYELGWAHAFALSKIAVSFLHVRGITKPFLDLGASQLPSRLLSAAKSLQDAFEHYQLKTGDAKSQ